jgi:adenine-specific DNA methylase
MVKSRELKRLAKKIIEKDKYKKIKKIKDKKEQIEILIYVIYSYLEKKYLELESKIRKFKDTEKDVFFAESRLTLIPYKINIFKLMPSEKDFNKIYECFNIVEEELENV